MGGTIYNTTPYTECGTEDHFRYKRNENEIIVVDWGTMKWDFLANTNVKDTHLDIWTRYVNCLQMHFAKKCDISGVVKLSIQLRMHEYVRMYIRAHGLRNRGSTKITTLL